MYLIPVDDLITISSSLSRVIEESFGPNGLNCMITTPSGKLIITRNGDCILQSLNMAHPIGHVIMSAIHKHHLMTGDNSKTMVLWLTEALNKVCIIEPKVRILSI